MIAIHRPRETMVGLSVLAFLAGMLAGCSKGEDKPAADGTKVTATPTAATPTPMTPQTAAPPENVEKTQAYLDMHKSFKEATLEAPPEKASRPPDETAAGKKVGEILRQITGENGTGGLWDKIRFMTPQGKRIQYEAVVKTSLGEFTIELLPDAAPNHARNFIALSRAGYYDGLAIDYILKQKGQDWTVLLAGCPESTGEAGKGSIGYWLKPEFHTKYKLKEGAVGAWPLESAACKFYISTSEEPWVDDERTIFGRISSGLDVVRKISLTPQQLDERTKEEIGFPREPVIIQKVTIVERA